MERPDDTALDDRPEALDGVRMNRADDILMPRVINAAPAVILVENIIRAPLVCAEQADPPRDSFTDESVNCRVIEFRHDFGNDVTLALNSAKEWGLAASSAAAVVLVVISALAQRSVFPLAADESLVHFDHADELLELLVLHGNADLVTHGPCRLVRAKPEHALDLEGADALFAGQHHVDDAEPVPQRLVCVLEDGPDQMREAISPALPAVRALPLPFHRLEFIDAHASAARAANAGGPAVADQIGDTSIFMREIPFELPDGHLVDNWFFGLGHGLSPVSLRPV